MSMSSSLEQPLGHAQFYILLVLSHRPMYGYALSGSINNQSLGSIMAPAGRLYPLIQRMITNGLIEPAGTLPAGKNDKNRSHYTITSEGTYRLRSELHRMRHTVKIGEAAGHFDDEIPADIRRLLDQLA